MKLDPNRNPKQFERAVFSLAQQRSKRAIEKQIQAAGQKLSAFSSVEMRNRTQAYFFANMQELITSATQDAFRFWC